MGLGRLWTLGAICATAAVACAAAEVGVASATARHTTVSAVSHSAVSDLLSLIHI